MGRLDDYRTALLAVFPEVSTTALIATLEDNGPAFPQFIIDHGLGSVWHERTNREEFQASRLSAEALYMAQSRALEEIDAVFESAGIQYAVFKGAATRLLLYDNPAIRACHDIDLLVRPEDRLRAAATLNSAGFRLTVDPRTIGHELEMSRQLVTVDLHWGLLRDGRLRSDPVREMLDRRRRASGTWMLSAEDALFVMLVHPAFAKHLASWEMGLHRIADIIVWFRDQPFDWQAVRAGLERQGVRTAAWATLRWAEMLTRPDQPGILDRISSEISPGPTRKAWLDRWLRKDLSERTSTLHMARLLGFSLMLHDRPGDVSRALAGRYRAHRRAEADLAAFQELIP